MRASDAVGKRFGAWEVLGVVRGTGTSSVQAKCDCGHLNENMPLHNLTSGVSRGCINCMRRRVKAEAEARAWRCQDCNRRVSWGRARCQKCSYANRAGVRTGPKVLSVSYESIGRSLGLSRQRVQQLANSDLENLGARYLAATGTRLHKLDGSWRYEGEPAKPRVVTPKPPRRRVGRPHRFNLSMEQVAGDLGLSVQYTRTLAWANPDALRARYWKATGKPLFEVCPTRRKEVA